MADQFNIHGPQDLLKDLERMTLHNKDLLEKNSTLTKKN